MGKLVPVKLGRLIKKLEKSNYKLTENVFKELLEIKNFKVPKNLFKSKFFTELVRDTLGYNLLTNPRATPAWDNLSRGQQETVFARVLRTEPMVDTTQEGRVEARETAVVQEELQEGDMGQAKVENAPKQIPAEAKSIVEANKRIKKYKNIVAKAFKKLGLTGITAEFTANVDSMMAQAKDVMINGAFVVVKDAGPSTGRLMKVGP